MKKNQILTVIGVIFLMIIPIVIPSPSESLSLGREKGLIEEEILEEEEIMADDLYFQNYTETNKPDFYFSSLGLGFYIPTDAVVFQGKIVYWKRGTKSLYSVDDYDDASEELEYTFSPTWVSTFPFTASLKVIDGVLYVVCYATGDATHDDEIITVETADLSSWDNLNNVTFTFISVGTNTVQDIFKLGSTIYYCYSYLNTNDLYFRDYATSTYITKDTALGASGQQYSTGDVKNDIYYYFHKEGDYDYDIEQFNGTTCSFSETLTSTEVTQITYYWRSILYFQQTKTLFVTVSTGSFGASVWTYTNANTTWTEEITSGSLSSSGFVFGHEGGNRILIGFNLDDWHYKVYNDSYAKYNQFPSGYTPLGGMDDWQVWYSRNLYCLIFAPGITKGRNTLDISYVEILPDKGTAEIHDETITNYWSKGEVVTLYDFGGSKVCMEAYVDDYKEDETPIRRVYLKAQWLSEFKRKVEHEITSLKTTDAILEEISPLFLAFMGVDISAGSATYQPNFLGRDYGNIFKNFAIREGWRWYVNYADMNFVIDNGLTDSGINVEFDEGDKIGKVKPEKRPYFISDCFVYGGVDPATGKRVVGYGHSSIPNSGDVLILYEANEIVKVNLDSMAQAVVDDAENEILTISFEVDGKGCIQWGEQIDFEFSPYSDRFPELGTAAKYYVNSIRYYPLTDIIRIEISDKLKIDQGDELKDKVDAQEETINQTAANIDSPDSKGISPAFIKIDADENFGANPEIENFIDGLTGWTIFDGSGCVSSYITEKTLDRTIKHVYQAYDNSGVNVAGMYKSFTGSLVFSGWLGTSDISKDTLIKFREGGDLKGILLIDSSSIQWYDGTGTTIAPALSNIWYHWTCVFDSTADTVDIYINGILVSTENLIAGITTNISRIDYESRGSDSGYYGYHSAFYHGDSLADAFTSLYDGTLKCKGIVVSGNLFGDNGLTIKNGRFILMDVNNGTQIISGGIATTVGANLSLFGGDHATLANVFRVRANGDEIFRSDTVGVTIATAKYFRNKYAYDHSLAGRDVYATVTGTFGYQSSSRVSKLNINPLLDVDSIIDALNPVTFYFNPEKVQGDCSKLQYGFVADEIEKILSELIWYKSKQDKDGKVIGEDTSIIEGFNQKALLPIAIKGIQNLRKENITLKAILTKLEERFESLEKRVG